MFRKSLKKIDNCLIQLQHYESLFKLSQQLQNFFGDITSLHLDIRQYLRQQTLPCQISVNIRLDHQNWYSKSAQFYKDDIENQQSVSKQSYELKEKQTNSQTKRTTHSKMQANKIKFNETQTELNRVKNLIEKIRVIIQNQNKIEKQLLQINNKEKMTQLCSNENIFDINRKALVQKENQVQSIIFQSIKNNLGKVIQECKQVQEDYKQLKEDHSKFKQYSESQGIDKKSLLTEMLKDSQILEGEDEQIENRKKIGKKPMSDFNYVVNSHKKMLKEIDFSGYRIEGGNPRKQKKVRPNACGNCNPQCVIF